jgi:hypothetical protein
MQITELPYWLQNTIICGRDNDDDDSGSEDGVNEGDDAEDDGQEDEGDDGSADDGAEGGSESDEAKALRKALNDERRLRRKAERENKQLKRGKDKATEEEKQSLEETREQLTESQTKIQKLAAGFLNKEISDKILAEARKQGFIDPTDALTDEVRTVVRAEADQDDEDPTDIVIDEAVVRSAVKKLADKKKHLVGKPNEGERSGSKYGSKKGTDDGKTGEKVLEDLYPSLR